MRLVFGDKEAVEYLVSSGLDLSLWLDTEYFVAYGNACPDDNLLFSHHCEDDGTNAVFYGQLFEKNGQEESPAKYTYHQISIAKRSIWDIDGEFVFFIFKKDEPQNLTVYTERIGTIPLYARRDQERISLATSMIDLALSVNYDDLDMIGIMNLLYYGNPIGTRTLIKNIKHLTGGTRYQFGSKDSASREYVFTYKESEHSDIREAISNVSASLQHALEKRIDASRDVTSSILLSGGLDSRLIVAAMKSTCPDQELAAYTFGQPGSEELFVAQQVANTACASFFPRILFPASFLESAEEYQRLSCGNDYFPQGYILKNLQPASVPSCFYTGFMLDLTLGGSYLPDELYSTDKPLSRVIDGMRSTLKLSMFDTEELDCLLRPESVLKEYEPDPLSSHAEQFDSFSPRDVVQAFLIDNRVCNKVLNREAIPRLRSSFSYPTTDRDFLHAISFIPAKHRYRHAFYRELFISQYPEYCSIPYNNTTLPIFSSIDEWRAGQDNESRREAAYAKLQYEQARAGHPVTYYPHYYSDFEGYSKYDEEWINLFHNVLLNDNSHLLQLGFSRDSLQSLLDKNISEAYSYRSKLIMLTSLELALSQLLT